MSRKEILPNYCSPRPPSRPLATRPLWRAWLPHSRESSTSRSTSKRRTRILRSVNALLMLILMQLQLLSPQRVKKDGSRNIFMSKTFQDHPLSSFLCPSQRVLKRREMLTWQNNFSVSHLHNLLRYSTFTFCYFRVLIITTTKYTFHYFNEYYYCDAADADGMMERHAWWLIMTVVVVAVERFMESSTAAAAAFSYLHLFELAARWLHKAIS